MDTSAAVGTVIFGTALATAFNMYQKRRAAITGSKPFKPTKKLSAKDSLLVTMLDDVTDGEGKPCYVITGKLFTLKSRTYSLVYFILMTINCLWQLVF